jgi:hypothetical protein
MKHCLIDWPSKSSLPCVAAPIVGLQQFEVDTLKLSFCGNGTSRETELIYFRSSKLFVPCLKPNKCAIVDNRVHSRTLCNLQQYDGTFPRVSKSTSDLCMRDGQLIWLRNARTQQTLHFIPVLWFLVYSVNPISPMSLLSILKPESDCAPFTVRECHNSFQNTF